jgi:transcriptional regulator with GAF, ATPase, and Fis domain
LQAKASANVTDESLNARQFAFKVKLIERTLMETGGNVARASRILELSTSYVRRLIRKGIVRRP